MADAKRLQRRCEDQSKRLFDYEEQVERLERARSQLFTDTVRHYFTAYIFINEVIRVKA